MLNRIITIDGSCGSDRSAIGKRVAEKLGIPFYHGAIIDRVAKKSRLARAVVAEHVESVQEGWLGLAHSQDFYGNSLYDRVFYAMKAELEALAQEGPCVIIGCCADQILKESVELLTVFVHSDDLYRIKSVQSTAGDRIKQAARHIRDTDRKRSLYYEYYTGHDWGCTENYFVTLNSGALGVDSCADLIIARWSGLSGEVNPCDLSPE